MSIYYKEGYKYQLETNYYIKTALKPLQFVTTEHLNLDLEGLLLIRKGYAWDGPSGPAVDTPNFMRGSLVHDALYQLIRQKHLPKTARKEADKLLQKICKEDGMSALRAWWVYQGVSRFGASSANPDNAKKITEAP